MTVFFLLLTSWLNTRFWQEIYAFEDLSCLIETLNCKNFMKTLFFLQDIRKSKSKFAFLHLKSVFFSSLIFWSNLLPCLFFTMPVPIQKLKIWHMQKTGTLKLQYVALLIQMPYLTQENQKYSNALVRKNIVLSV